MAIPYTPHHYILYTDYLSITVESVAMALAFIVFSLMVFHELRKERIKFSTKEQTDLE